MSRPVGILETLREIEPYHFEQCVADIWQECQGWRTKVTQSSRDAGLDVVGFPPGRDDQATALQAKRYGPDNPVGSKDIQQYAALRQQYDLVTAVTVVTTSRFTKPAEERASELDVKCIDGQGLATIVEREHAGEIVEWYAAGKPEDW